jgi:IS605 OrfB family transposase
MVILHHPGDVQLFNKDPIEPAHKIKAGLMMEVRPLPRSIGVSSPSASPLCVYEWIPSCVGRKHANESARTGRKLFENCSERMHVRNQREDFAHKVSRTIVILVGVIVTEQLNIKGLAAGMLAKSVNDAGWPSFTAKLTYKAEEVGRVLLKVNPRGTSQRRVCGAPNLKTLSQRWHQYDSCGL